MNSKKEYRAYDFDLRAQQNEKHGHFVEGRAIVFNQVYDNGWFDEIIEPGALDKTDLRDVRLLVNHDTKMIPLARSRNNNENSTMQLIVGSEGMDIRADLDVERNATAQATYSAAARGDVSGMSFMFVISGEKWEDLQSDHPTRIITDIEKVFEVSICTFPAYEEGTSISARNDAEALENAKATLESARRNAESEAREVRKAELRAKLNILKGVN